MKDEDRSKAVFLMAFVAVLLFVSSVPFADEPKKKAPVLDDATWADIRSESAELQVLDERFQKLAAQVELTRQAFAAKRAVWQQKINAAREKAQIINECFPDAVQKRWVRQDGSDVTCAKPSVTKPKEAAPK